MASPIGLPSTSNSFCRFVPPPRSTLLGPTEFRAGSRRGVDRRWHERPSLKELRSRRGVSRHLLIERALLLLELNSTAGGASLTVTVVCTEPGFRRHSVRRRGLYSTFSCRNLFESHILDGDRVSPWFDVVE